MTHSALLIAAGALLTFVLAALVFTPTLSAEERHVRDVQRLLRALEAQRRVRDAQRRREARRPVRRVEPEPAVVHNDRAERRAAEAELAAQPPRAEPEPGPAPAPALDLADEPKPLTELPLFSWASRIESEERPQR